MLSVLGPFALAVVALYVLLAHSVWLGLGLGLLAPLIFYGGAILVSLDHESTVARPLLAYASKVGMNHVETANMYLTSEAFLGAVLPECSAELDGDDMLVQTKVRPYKDTEGFHKTLDASLRVLKLDRVDLLSLHGVNTSEHAEYVFFNGKEYLDDTLGRAKREGKATCVSFSTHLKCADILKVVNSAHQELDYINLHFGFFSSYTSPCNQDAVLRCGELGLPVYCISPLGQQGDLFRPSKMLEALCHPLHPAEFQLLFLMTHKGVSDVGGSVSVGGALVPTHFTFHARAVALLPYASKLLPPIVKRLRDTVRDKLGSFNPKKYARFSQGDGGLPGAMALALLLSCYTLWKAFGMETFAKRMCNNISQPGDWCAGGRLDVLRGKDEDSEEIKEFRRVLGHEDADVVLPKLRELMTIVPPKSDDGVGAKVFSHVMALVMHWLLAGGRLTGKVKAETYAEMPKTVN